ncbi:MAG: MGMT family protein [Microbacteriaceae bacterium]|nr:MGMT family protein [Microbacteriaceae bacterium]
MSERSESKGAVPELLESVFTHDAFVEAVISVVETIPPGRVMAYGEVAAAVGSRAARAVGRIMAHSGGELPWWRVVYADGHLLPGYEAQALAQYAIEGTPLTPGGAAIDMRRARWSPGAP